MDFLCLRAFHGFCILDLGLWTSQHELGILTTELFAFAETQADNGAIAETRADQGAFAEIITETRDMERGRCEGAMRVVRVILRMGFGVFIHLDRKSITSSQVQAVYCF